MKKSLLALAVLGAFATGAQAQTNVSIGGVLQANFKNYKVSSSARATSNELRIDDDYNSRFWLSGTEDLGGGLSALFYVENRFNTDQRQSTGGATGAGLADGDTFVGLKGGFGQVTLGKHSWMSVQGLVTEFVSASGNLVSMPTSMTATYTIMDQAGGYLDITRRVNSITYRTPVMSGFNGTLGVSTASAGAEGTITAGNPRYEEGREYYLQGGYNNGPLSLSLAYRDFTTEGRPAAGVDDQQVRFSGSYKFGGFKVGLIADQAKRENVNGGDSKRTAFAIPVSYAFGNSTILASYAQANDLDAGATNTLANTGSNTGAKMATVGYDYALSKRTNVGVFYSRLDNDARGQYQPFLAGTSFTGSGLLAGETASTFALGVKHTF